MPTGGFAAALLRMSFEDIEAAWDQVDSPAVKAQREAVRMTSPSPKIGHILPAFLDDGAQHLYIYSNTEVEMAKRRGNEVLITLVTPRGFGMLTLSAKDFVIGLAHYSEEHLKDVLLQLYAPKFTWNYNKTRVHMGWDWRVDVRGKLPPFSPLFLVAHPQAIIPYLLFKTIMIELSETEVAAITIAGERTRLVTYDKSAGKYVARSMHSSTFARLVNEHHRESPLSMLNFTDVFSGQGRELSGAEEANTWIGVQAFE